MTFTPTTIAGKRLIPKLEPWLSEDLEIYADSLSQVFQAVLEIAEESGTQGEVVRENEALNPSFAYDAVGGVPAIWLSNHAPVEAGATLTVVAGVGGPAPRALRIGMPEAFPTGAVLPLGVLPQTPHTVSLWVARANGSNEVKLRVGAGTIGDNFVTFGTTIGVFVRHSETWIPEAGVPQYVTIEHNEGAQTLYVEQVQVTAGEGAVSYFDGDSPGGYWVGTPGASVSSNKYIPAWGKLMNPLTCPAKYLPYLAQFTGTEIPKTSTEEEARRILIEECNLFRGTLKHLQYTIKAILGTTPFTIKERTNPLGEEKGYYFLVLVPPGHNSVALREGIEGAKPGGVLTSIIEVSNAWISGALRWNEVKAGLKWSTPPVEGEY